MTLDPLVSNVILRNCQEPHAPWWHLPVGLFAVSSGLFAALMAFRIGKLRVVETAAWILLIAFCTLAELRMIVWGDADAAEERKYAACETEKSFQIMETESQRQFQATISGMGQVFDKTKLAADTATEGVRSITGGDSWGWVTTYSIPPLPPGVLSFSFTNEGKYTLRHVSLMVARLPNISEKPGISMMRCDVGDIPAHYKGWLVGPPCLIKPDPEITNKYSIIINALNGSVVESLSLSKGGGLIGEVRSSNGKKVLKKF
jgi:hypothetical protein